MVGAKSVLAALALAPLGAAAALAQNSYSFLAERSAVRYTVAPAKPVMNCAAVAGLATAETTIVSVRLVRATDGVPEHCRVSGLIQPEIRFELNLPADWNRRFYMHGNGGFAGETPELGGRPGYRAKALQQGFAVIQTNTGHDAAVEPLATFAVSYQKRVDYAFRAVHMTVVEGKRITAAYYGRGPAYSYWGGCSTGGRQGLISAQRFPQDFDGIVAGAPVLAFVDTVIQSLWNGLMMLDARSSHQDEAGVGRRLCALRCQGRAEGRHHRRSAPLRLRSGARRGAMPGRPGRRELPDARPDRGAEEDLCRPAG